MASYLLNYDVGPIAAMHPQLLAFVKENRHVKQWSHPYPGLFLLKSDAGATALASSFGSFFTVANSHLLVPVDLASAQGIMPIYIWEWLALPEQAPLGLLGHLRSQQEQ